MMNVEALGFDVFGTVVDWRSSIARQAHPYLIDCGLSHVEPEVFADRWRGRYQPAMEACRAGGRDYVPLDDLHSEMLDDVLGSFDTKLAEGNYLNRESFVRLWEQLDPWPDVVDGLRRLRSNFIVAPISNGSIALMTHLARYAGLHWDAVLGADISRSYKPVPGTYLAAAKALRLDPCQVAMVAAHNDDLHAARAVGMRTVFVRRSMEHGPGQKTDLHAESDWDVVVDDLTALADVLDCPV